MNLQNVTKWQTCDIVVARFQLCNDLRRISAANNSRTYIIIALNLLQRLSLNR